MVPCSNAVLTTGREIMQTGTRNGSSRKFYVINYVTKLLNAGIRNTGNPSAHASKRKLAFVKT